MKKLFLLGLTLALNLSGGAEVLAQAAPGWSTVKQMGDFTVTSQQENNLVGMGQDAAGNMYLAGTFVGTTFFDGTAAQSMGEADIFVAKYDPAGALLWVRQMHGTGQENVYSFAVAPNGRCLLYGFFSGDTGGDLTFDNAPMLVGSRLLPPDPNGRYPLQMFGAGIAPDGTLTWAHHSSIGEVRPTSVVFDNAGNAYAAGWSTTPETINRQVYPLIGNKDALLAKINPTTGDVNWVRRVGGLGGNTENLKLLVGSSGAVYWSLSANRTLSVDGITLPVGVNTGSYICLVKVTPNNQVRWARNDLMMDGQVRRQGALVAVDEARNSLYMEGPLYSAQQMTFPGTTIAPIVKPAGSATTCVAVCDTAGTVTSARIVANSRAVPGVAGPYPVRVEDVWSDGTRTTYLTNTSQGGETTYEPNGTPIGFAGSGLLSVVRVNEASQQVEWVRVGGVPGGNTWTAYTKPTGMVHDAAGNIWVGGNFLGTATFNATTISSSSIRPNIFLAKLDMTTLTGARSQDKGLAWSVYPNPSPGAATLTGLPAKAQVRVYDAQGRLVRQLGAVPTAATPRQLEGLSAGLYLLRVTNTSETYQPQRLVVE